MKQKFLRYTSLTVLALCGGLLILTVTVLLCGCTTPPTHNSHGGYIDACGDKAPMLGDDC
jgi:hypothetical protein